MTSGRSFWGRLQNAKSVKIRIFSKIRQSPLIFIAVPRNQKVAISKLPGNCPNDPLRSIQPHLACRSVLLSSKFIQGKSTKKLKNWHLRSPLCKNATGEREGEILLGKHFSRRAILQKVRPKIDDRFASPLYS